VLFRSGQQRTCSGKNINPKQAVHEQLEIRPRYLTHRKKTRNKNNTMRIKNISCLLLLSATLYTNANIHSGHDDRNRLRAKSSKDDKIFPTRSLLESSGPTCSTPCNFDTRCVGTNDGCPLCRRNRCVPIPSCNANCTFSEDCSGAPDGCSVCNTKNNQCVQPFPKCNTDCTKDSECSDSTDNCAVCNIVRRVCVSSLPNMGSYCYSDDHCLGARDGSTICNIVKRQCVVSIPHRGSGCSTDIDCLGAKDGSSSCVNGMCASSKLFANNPKCNSQTCSSDCECSSATDGCIACVNGYCVSNRYNNNDLTSRCGLGCLSNSECSGAGTAINSCQICQNNICVSGMSNTTRGVECISTEQSLKNAFAGAAGSSTVTLCKDSVVTLTQELIVTIGGIKLICERPKTCIIKGAGSYRLITFTEGNVQIDGIIFQSGDVAGNVSKACYAI